MAFRMFDDDNCGFIVMDDIERVFGEEVCSKKI